MCGPIYQQKYFYLSLFIHCYTCLPLVVGTIEFMRLCACILQCPVKCISRKFIQTRVALFLYMNVHSQLFFFTSKQFWKCHSCFCHPITTSAVYPVLFEIEWNCIFFPFTSHFCLSLFKYVHTYNLMPHCLRHRMHLIFGMLQKYINKSYLRFINMYILV